MAELRLADAPVDWGDDAFDVVLVGDATGDMARAVTHAGGRVVARAAPGQSFDADPGALVAIDLAGLDDRALDAVAELAERADLVCCDWEQLDRVAGALLFTDAQFLCAPSMAERVGALAIAARELAAPAGVRDTDGVRLRRFSGEVARIAATLGQLAADEGATLADRRPAYDAGPGPVAATLDPQVVRQAIRARRLRAGFFADRLLEEPAWDMLLDLFAAELEAVPVAVSSLCIAANVAPTTALRWIVRLSDAGLFERRPDPQDRRRAFVALTARGSAAMRGYVAELARAGLRLG